MTNLKTCSECNGRGFVAKWDTRYRPTILSKCDCVRCGGIGSVEMSPEESLAELARAFGLDIVIPVRCRECIHYWAPDADFYDSVCKRKGGLVGPTDESFCSYGERKNK